MDIDSIKNELISCKAELESRQQRTHKHIYGKEEPVSHNFSEQVKQTENDQLVMALEADALNEIAQINNALQRIEDELYLLCAHCGEPIGEQRLLAIPYTASCIQCAA